MSWGLGPCWKLWTSTPRRSNGINGINGYWMILNEFEWTWMILNEFDVLILWVDAMVDVLTTRGQILRTDNNYSTFIQKMLISENCTWITESYILYHIIVDDSLRISNSTCQKSARVVIPRTWDSCCGAVALIYLRALSASSRSLDQRGESESIKHQTKHHTEKLPFKNNYSRYYLRYHSKFIHFFIYWFTYSFIVFSRFIFV